MKTSAAEVLAFAAREIGNKEYPQGDNLSKYNDWYGRPGWSWCNIFVDYCLWNVCHANGEKSPLEGIVSQFGPAYTGDTMAAGQRGTNGMSWIADPVPGALPIYDSDWAGITDHIGIVESVQANGLFTAIEGNTGSPEGVYRVQRSNVNHYVRGFVMLPYGNGGGFTPPPGPIPAYYRVLAMTSPLMSGQDVKNYQQRMYDRGWRTTPDVLNNGKVPEQLRFYMGKLGYQPGRPFAVDGVFGVQTLGITLAFQVEKGLVADGQVGPVTITAAYRSDNVTP